MWPAAPAPFPNSETLTVTTTAGTFVISPAAPLGVAITDTSGSGTGWLLEISYNNGGSWQTVAANAAAGLTSYDPTTQLPSIASSAACKVRATNNTTHLAATSATFALTSDEVVATWTGVGNPNQGGVSLAYASDAVDANVVGGNPATCTFQADTSGGFEGNTSASNPIPNALTADFADDLTIGGGFNFVTSGDLSFDRPASICPPNQNFIIS